MNLYIDTEFNGYRGELISLALVDAEGREFYHVLNMGHIRIDRWVEHHVVPVLYRCMENPSIGGLSTLQAQLEMWLAEYDSIHVIADWPDDIKHFCDVLITGPGTRIDTPPMTMEIRRDLDADSEVPHNALADARAIRFLHLKRTEP